jgi:FkbM family methyltransferase
MQIDQKNIKIALKFSHQGRLMEYIINLDQAQMSQKLISEYLSNNIFYEPETSLFLLDILKEGDTFIDIGAHIGYFALLSASIVGNSGRVFAFEPETSNFDRLKQNILENKMYQIVPIKKAVFSEVEIKKLFINLDNDGGHAFWDVGLHPYNNKSTNKIINLDIESTTLDDWFKNTKCNNIRCILIDTEGSEVEVLKGARKLLSQMDIPFIICELNEFGLLQMNSSQQELRGLMLEMGYDTYIFNIDLIEKNIQLDPEINEKRACFVNNNFDNLIYLIPETTQLKCHYVFNILFARENNMNTKSID